MLKITQARGEGQGSCVKCDLMGKWNRMWMCFLYEVEGYIGLYCMDCIKEMEKENDSERNV